MDPIRLFSGSGLLPASSDESLLISGSQQVPPNLFILGTVNVDDSTFPFSRKVLDRANVIEFSAIDFQFGSGDDPSETALVDLDRLRLSGHCILSRPFRRLEDIPFEHAGRKWNSSLVEINLLLASAEIPLGYRVRDEILIYMAYAVDLSDQARQSELSICQDSAFDFQILQRILPRISGPPDSVGETLDSLLPICKGRFFRSAAKIQSMLRRPQKLGSPFFW